MHTDLTGLLPDSQYQFGKDRNDLIFTAKDKEGNYQDLMQLEPKYVPPKTQMKNNNKVLIQREVNS